MHRGVFPLCLLLLLLLVFFSHVGHMIRQKGPRPAVDEHVKERMLRHLTDLTKEFGALKYEQPGLQAPMSHSRRSQDVLLRNLATLCHQQQTEIDLLRGHVNEVERLVCQLTESQNRARMDLNNLGSGCQQQLTEIGGNLNDLRTRMKTPLQEFSIRLVRCYAIARGNS